MLAPRMHLISVVGRALCDAVGHCVVVEEGEGPIIAQVALPLTAKHHADTTDIHCLRIHSVWFVWDRLKG